MIPMPRELEVLVKRHKVLGMDVPVEYVDFHRAVALTDVATRTGWTLIQHCQVSLDKGMSVVEVTVNVGNKYVLELRWDPDGAWMERDWKGRWVRVYDALKSVPGGLDRRVRHDCDGVALRVYERG